MFGVNIQNAAQLKWAQNRIRAIIHSNPHAPRCKNRFAIVSEKGRQIADRRPRGIIHSPRIGTTVRFAGIETRGTR